MHSENLEELSLFSDSYVFQPRNIHIGEFPQEFYVKLKSEIIKNLMSSAAVTVGGIEHLADTLKIRYNMLWEYRENKHFIPLVVLRKLCTLTGGEVTLEQIEPYIVAYKGSGNSQPILNPNLPLKETPKLFALMGHLTGDGGHGNKERTMSYYFNTTEELIAEFVTLLHNVFGDVPTHISITKRGTHIKAITRVRFGNTIIRLLRHLYHVDFRTFTARVPRCLFELPKEYAAAYLRAYIDDEGNIDDSRIEVCSANESLSQDVYTLVQVKFPEIRKFVSISSRERGNNWADQYRIRFGTEALETYHNFIGFTHPEKKYALKCALARKERDWCRRNEGDSHRLLLECLQLRPMTVKDLARMLDITSSAVHYHFKLGLLPSGLVRIRRENNGDYETELFEITEKGRKILSWPSLGLLQMSKGNQQRKRGQIRIKILKMLVEQDMNAKQLGQRMGIKHRTIQPHLDGKKERKFQGLVKLNLVHRSGSGTKLDPYVYSLSDTGKKFLVEFESIFPEFWNSV